MTVKKNTSPSKDQSLGRIAGLVIPLIYVLCRLIQWPTVNLFDDAFISFRYARNLADGLGFIYNPGEAYLGVTGPLWGLLCSLFYLLPEPETLIRLFNIFLGAATLVLVSRYMKWGTINYLIASAIMIILPYSIRIGLGGMESDLFLFVLIACLYLIERMESPWGVTLACIGFFIRPEMALMAIIGSIYSLYRFRSKAVIPILSGLLVVSIGMTIMYLFYGSILPQSVIGKSGLEQPLIITFRSLLLRDPSMIAIFLISILGAWLLIKNKAANLFHLFVALYIVAFLAKSQIVFTWYIYPILYFYADLSSRTAKYILEKIRLPQQVIFTVLLAFPLIISLIINLYIGNNTVNSNIYEPLHSYWENNSDTDRQSIFADDIGIIGYTSRRYIYDSESLIHPIASDYDYKLEVIVDKTPDYIFMNITPEVDSFFRANQIYNSYKPVSRFSRNGVTDCTIVRAKLTPGWKMDYYLLKRNNIRP